MPSREDIIQALKRDFPSVPQHAVDVAVDLYLKDPRWFEQRMKQAKKDERKTKKGSSASPLPSTDGLVQVLSAEEFEKLHGGRQVFAAQQVVAELKDGTEGCEAAHAADDVHAPPAADKGLRPADADADEPPPSEAAPGGP